MKNEIEVNLVDNLAYLMEMRNLILMESPSLVIEHQFQYCPHNYQN